MFNIPDGDVVVLKAAIATANGNGQADTINLAANETYTLTTVDNTTEGANWLRGVATDGGNALTINGNGASIVRSAANTPDFRLILVNDGATLNVSNPTAPRRPLLQRPHVWARRG